MTFSFSSALAAAFWLAAHNPLDGSWCSIDGQRITIDGFAVTTPGNQATTGRYNQDAFTFEIPAGERDAGAAIWMERKSNSTARVSRLDEQHRGPPPHAQWYGCDVTSAWPGAADKALAGLSPALFPAR